MTEAEIQAASEFWSVGPGKAVMERWPVEWGNNALGYRLHFGPFGSFRLCRAERGGDFEFLRIELLVTAIHTIHGHYLDKLREFAKEAGAAFVYTDDCRGHRIAMMNSIACLFEARKPTYHELLAAAMDVAFGENDEREKKNGMV